MEYRKVFNGAVRCHTGDMVKLSKCDECIECYGELYDEGIMFICCGVNDPWE